jgi:subtilisin family serine protease
MSATLVLSGTLLAQTPAAADVAGRYVVVLRDGVSSAAASSDVIAEAGAETKYIYTSALNGFAVEANASQAAALAADPRVASVTADGEVSLSSTQPVPSPPNTYWGLDRIDERALPLSGSFSYTGNTSNVTAYVIDTGIRFDHSEFGGRASTGYDFVDGGSADDCNGHGTHVSGTIGGKTYGVAKQVKLKAVRVFGCSGGAYYSTIIAAVDWVTAHAHKPAVVNMSLGGGAYQPLDDAVTRSIGTGITYAVASGNSNDNACYYSPARTPAAITVNATGDYSNYYNPVTDDRAAFSNYGACTDIFAPGSLIKSAWWTSSSATETISGTSMATPHVAGVVAQLLSAYPAASPASIRTALAGRATSGVVGDPQGSPNLLLYSYNRPTTRITLNATPEPVPHGGGTIYMKGKLTRNSTNYAGKTVKFYFDPAGWRPNAYKGYTTTDALGNYRKPFRQTADGTWMAYFPTSGSTMGSKATDYVNVL